MSKKALKVVVEVKFRAVSCPGVHLPTRDDVYLSVCFMGQYRQSEDIAAVFPLLIYEKMTFEKIFKNAVDPGDIAAMLEYETVRIELVQLMPPTGDTLACLDKDARRFLFPEPKLGPSFSGVSREVLMTRAYHFPGIAPRLEFSTKTTIVECLADDRINIYPNITMRSVIRTSNKCSGKPRLCSTGGTLPLTPRSRSLSSLRPGTVCCRARLGPDSTGSSSTSQSMRASWPGASSPLAMYSSSERRRSFLNSLSSGKSRNDSSSSGTDDLLDRPSYETPAAPNTKWEEVHGRVQALLTTPKAVRRLLHEATDSEVDRILRASLRAQRDDENPGRCDFSRLGTTSSLYQ